MEFHRNFSGSYWEVATMETSPRAIQSGNAPGTHMKLAAVSHADQPQPIQTHQIPPQRVPTTWRNHLRGWTPMSHTGKANQEWLVSKPAPPLRKKRHPPPQRGEREEKTTTKHSPTLAPPALRVRSLRALDPGHAGPRRRPDAYWGAKQGAPPGDRPFFGDQSEYKVTNKDMEFRYRLLMFFFS